MSIQIPADVKAAAITRIRAGEKHTDIARDLGLSRFTIDNWSRQNGYSARRRKPTEPAIPVRRDTSWQEDAACRGVFGFTEWDQPEDGATTRRTVKTSWLRQKQICAGCPVRVECLESALKHAPPYGGVFGGLSPEELNAEYRRRRRGAGRHD